MAGKIIIKEAVYDKVMHWVEKCPLEVSGFGKVIVNDDGDFVITEAYLLDQEVGAAHTDIDAKSLAKLMYTSKDEPGQLRWWWHSHVNMSVFWSGQDTATINELGKQGWIAATVFNKKHEYRSAICYETEVKTPWGTKKNFQLDDNLTLEIESTRYDAETIKAWDDQLAAKVKEKKYTPPTPVATPRQGDLILGNYMGMTNRSKRDAISYDLEAYGAYGYGVEVERVALSMSRKDYIAWLEDEQHPPSEAWLKVDEKLMVAWRSGRLDELQDRFNIRQGL